MTGWENCKCSAVRWSMPVALLYLDWKLEYQSIQRRQRNRQTRSRQYNRLS